MGVSALCAGFLSSLVCAEPTMALRNVKCGDAIPPFTVKGLDGTSMTKNDLAGKPAVMLFARPDHRASLTALQEVNRVRRDYGDDALVVLVISTDDKERDYFSRIVETYQLKVTIALDPGREMYGTYGLIVAPTTLVVDSKGILRFELKHLPPNYTDRLRRHLDLLLGRITEQEHDAGMNVTRTGIPEPQRKANRKLVLAETLMGQGDYTQALPILAGLNTDDAAPRIKMLLGICHVEVGNLSEAGELLESSALIEARPEGLTLARARLAVARKLDDRAQVLLLEALDEGIDRPSVLYELGRLYERRKDLEKAVESYRKAVEYLLDSR